MMRSPQGPSDFVLGLDLGQSQDFTAAVVLQRIIVPLDAWTTDLQQKTETFYHVRHLERPPLGTSYPAIVSRVQELLQSGPLAQHPSALVVDGTGVGRPVIDLFRQAHLTPIAVTITGGEQESVMGLDYRVPKRTLVSTLQLAFQTRKLKIAGGLPEAEVLVKELLNFKVKITATAHDTYEAWREGQHDDLVLATALAVWWAERQDRSRIRTATIVGV